MHLQKRCLDLLRKDVHAAGNDHVIEPVGKEQIAFFIDIADTEFFDLKISSRDGLSMRCIACIKAQVWQLFQPRRG